MELSRKRRKELKNLRNNAEYLLSQQKELLGHAGQVFAEASHQAKALGEEQLMPRVNERIENVRPYIDKNVAKARRAADHIKMTAAPVVAAALAKTISTLDSIDSRQKARALEDYGVAQGILEKPKKKSGFIGLVLGAAAAAVVGYAIWNTLREDDEDMWVSAD